MNQESIAASFSAKTVTLDGMPFHKGNNAITKPEMGASLVFADQIASLAFQIKHLDDHGYIPKLKKLMLSEAHKMFPIKEATADRYVDLSIHELCLNTQCKNCHGRGYTPTRYKARKIAKVESKDETWRTIEIAYKKGLNKVDNNEKKMANFLSEIEKLAKSLGINALDLHAEPLLRGWGDKRARNTLEKDDYEERKPKSQSYTKMCSRCNGTGEGRLLDKERAEFIGVSAVCYGNRHKKKYEQIYARLRDKTQQLQTH